MAVENCELVVLCGGRGKRLNPVTETVPKALVPVQGRPIVDHVVHGYKVGGIENVTFCVGYKGEMIRNHFSEISRDESAYSFSDSGENASMLRRIFDAGKQVKKQTMIVAYCDTFIDLSPDVLLASHRKMDTKTTIVTAEVTNPFGIVQIDRQDKVQSFIEKPRQNYFIGTFVIERNALDLADDSLLNMPDGQGLVAFFHKLINLEQLGSYRHEGLQITFNTEEERVQAENELHRFYTLEEN